MFPSPIRTKGFISEGAMNQGLKRMGYQGRHCPHGFRTTASTMLNEQGFNRDWIERQLAHEDTNQIRAVYNDAQYLEDRVKMMGWWSEELLRLESDTS
jgi:integrase